MYAWLHIAPLLMKLIPEPPHSELRTCGASSAFSQRVKSTARRRVRRLTQDLRVGFLLAISAIRSPRGDVEFQEKSRDRSLFRSHSSCMRSLPDTY